MKAILFDLDGTLIDSTKGIIESFNHAFSSFNEQEPKAEDICSLIGHPLEVMFSRLGAKEDRLDEYIKRYKENYQKISIQTTKLLPQAKEAIELASSLAPIAVVTTKTALYSKQILEHFKVLKHFSAVVGREDVTHPKPDAEPILAALKRLDVAPSKEVYMIGDTPMDLQSAKNSKINAIGLSSGYGKKEDLLPYETELKDNAYEAVHFLKNKWNK